MVGGRLADPPLFRSLVGTIGMLAVLLGAVAGHRVWSPALFVGVLLVSVFASALAILLQMRLMGRRRRPDDRRRAQPLRPEPRERPRCVAGRRW